jgi:uncharacterized protein involved in exopolysaccharide biosynthesis
MTGTADLTNERLVSVAQLLRVALSSWKVILLAMLLGLVGGAVYAMLARPVYSGTVLVAVEQEVPGGLGAALSGELGALASLAGVSVGQTGSRKAEYLALLRSESFALRFLDRQGLVDTMHGISTRGPIRSIVNRYWVHGDRDAPELRRRDAAKFFRERLLRVGEDKKSGLVAIQVESTDPVQAAEWANSFVTLFNEDVRLRESRSAKARLKYLEAELERNRTAEIRNSIGRLIEGELNTIMITNVQRDFALRLIDPASASPVGRPDRPKRAQFSLFGAFLGMFCGLIFALSRRRREWFPDPVCDSMLPRV